MDFDKPKVYGDTSITDGLVLISKQTKALSQVGFMAPEVANAQYKQDYASPASDLFSLGVAGHLILSDW